MRLDPPSDANRSMASAARRPRSGKRRLYSPARTPTTLKPLISGMLATISGIRPETKPTTSSLPPNDTQRVLSSNTSPPTGSNTRSQRRLSVSRPTSSRNRPVLRIRSCGAAIRRKGSTLSFLLVAAITFAPNAFARSQAASPTPPLAPCTSTH